MAKRKKPDPPPDPFALLYPNVAGWALDGWIELGPTDWSRSFIRVMDIGGTVWEGADRYPTVHAAMLAADAAIAAWLGEN